MNASLNHNQNTIFYDNSLSSDLFDNQVIIYYIFHKGRVMDKDEKDIGRIKSQNMTCTICEMPYNLDDSEKGHMPTVLGGCGHTFCKRCVLKMKQCPLDRKPFKQANVFKNFELLRIIGEHLPLGPSAQEIKIEKEAKKKRKEYTQSQMERAHFIANNPRLPPPGNIKKSATYAQGLDMSAHVDECNHPRCSIVWSGMWGSFIGGQEGSLYFDLTPCPEGRRLNQLIGWNYYNPKI